MKTRRTWSSRFVKIRLIERVGNSLCSTCNTTLHILPRGGETHKKIHPRFFSLSLFCFLVFPHILTPTKRGIFTIMSARERDSDTNNQPAASTSSSSPHPQRGGVSHHIKRDDDENSAHQQNSKKNKTPKLLSKTTAVVLPLTVVHVLTIAPARLVAAIASVVGFGTSAGLLRTAYAPAMNRCRCHLKTETQWLAESASRCDEAHHR